MTGKRCRKRKTTKKKTTKKKSIWMPKSAHRRKGTKKRTKGKMRKSKHGRKYNRPPKWAR